MDQDAEDINDVEDMNHEDTMKRDYYSQYCQNCFRKQHKYLVDSIDSRKYRLQFTICNSSQINPKQKFRHVLHTRSDTDTSYRLCQECDRYLCFKSGLSPVKVAKNIWLSFIYGTQSDQRVTHEYRTKVWQPIPKLWQYWLVDTLPTKYSEYIGITIDFPESVIVERILEVEAWNNDIESMKLPRLASACNKYPLTSPRAQSGPENTSVFFNDPFSGYLLSYV